MDLIDRNVAIAAMKDAMKEAARGEGFNPFQVLNALPTVEAVTEDEINAAMADRDYGCELGKCRKCDYHNFCYHDGYGIQYGLLVDTYRQRKEKANAAD